MQTKFTMKEFFQNSKRKIIHAGFVFLFFLICFNLINWFDFFLFGDTNLTQVNTIEIAVAAALIAKIALVADHLPFTNLFRKKPLIFSIFWKTGIYWALLLIVRFGIRFVPIYIKLSGSFARAYKESLMAINWNVFMSIEGYYLFLLFIFVTFQELAYKIGPKRMRKLFFGF